MSVLDPMEKCIMLLVMTEDIIKQRRWIEQACGYSEDYGGDHVLIKHITQHLKHPDITHIVSRVKEVMQLTDMDIKKRQSDSK